MNSPFLMLLKCSIALLLAFPLALLAVYGVSAYADERDAVTLGMGGVFALLGALTFRAAMRCVGQGRRDLSLQGRPNHEISRSADLGPR